MSKIYDCFTFFNELDLLEIRLSLLSPVVDFFVIVECAKTQQGNNKPYYFEKNQDRYSKWKNKIIHIKVEDVEEISHEVIEDWSIENHQRNCIFRGLVNARPDDIIIISDLDEIPNPYLLTHLNDYMVQEYPKQLKTKLKNFVKKSIKFILGKYKKTEPLTLETAIEKEPIALNQRFFYYFMNCQNISNDWQGSIILRFKAFRLPQVIRDTRRKIPFVSFDKKNEQPSGWHFSYLGGKDSIVKKLNSIIEGHRINDDIKLPEHMTTEEYISYCIENGLDLYQKDTYKFVSLVEIGIPNADFYVNKYPNYFKLKEKND
jgi:beta-1,4-mannosyl-glycoprotein beta-1,4-N-acetylglucosaminyltransferase